MRRERWLPVLYAVALTLMLATTGLGHSSVAAHDATPVVETPTPESSTADTSSDESRDDTSAVATGTAQDDYYTIDKNGSLVVSTPGVLANDDAYLTSDECDAPAFDMPAHGELITPDFPWTVPGSFAYYPFTNYVGTDVFSYAIHCTHEDFPSRTSFIVYGHVHVTVTGPAAPLPTPSPASCATNDSYATTRNTRLNVTAPTLLANDPGGQAVVGFTAPLNGYVYVRADGTFLYIPATDYVGNDSFTYTVRCSKPGEPYRQSEATVKVVVKP